MTLYLFVVRMNEAMLKKKRIDESALYNFRVLNFSPQSSVVALNKRVSHHLWTSRSL